MSAKETGPRLGRGLAALLGEPPATRALPQLLPVERLEPGPFQPRQDMAPEALAELAASIRLQGVLQPILVRPHPTERDRYQIIAGERRWRAAQLAQLHEVPVHTRTLSDGEAMAAALVENLQRADLNAIEEAEGYRRLLEEFGLTQERLGEAVGKSRSHVANSLRLLHLPPPVQAALRGGGISAGHARALLAHPEPEKALAVVVARGLNVRQAEALAQAASRPAAPLAARRRVPAPEIAALEAELSANLGLRVEIAHAGPGGSLRILYRDLDQLDAVLARLRRG